MPRIQRDTKGRQPRANKTSRKETTVPERIYIATLCEKSGKSTREVAKETGIPQSTVTRIAKAARDGAFKQHLPLQSIENFASKHRSGRPQLLSESEKDKIAEKVVENRDSRELQANAILKELNLQISPSTLQQLLYDRGYARRDSPQKPALSEKQKETRLEFA